MTGSDAGLPELGSDADEDEALNYAIALSLQEQSAPKATASPTSVATEKFAPSTNSTFGMLALDRKKMEEERLQRLAKKRQHQVVEESDDEVVEVVPLKKSRIAPRDSIETQSSLRFPKGVVKRTWAQGYPHTSDTITIEEVLQKDQLSLAVLSSFQWDEEWLLSKVDLRKSNLLLVAFAADNGQQDAMRSNVPPGIRFCFPAMNGPGAMHSKLQLLKYPQYLRVVIPTGNLVPHDWGEGGVLENMVFLIDLPRLPNSDAHRPTVFSTELGRFLQALGLDQNMVDSLRNYDFSSTEDLGFVYSKPGGHLDESRKTVGYCGLGKAVAELGLSSAKPIQVDIACASLGSLNRELICAIYNACQGDDGLKEYHERVARTRANKAVAVPDRIKQNFRIYFPKRQTVVGSKGGTAAGGTICLQAKWWRAPTFPRDLIRDCVNTKDGLLMHTKVIFVRPVADRGEAQASESPGWAYVGSSNLSESAWGRLVKDKSTGKVKMTCRNWECGVVIPLRLDKSRTDRTYGEGGLAAAFDGRVPVPMRVPAAIYTPTDEPWFYSES